MTHQAMRDDMHVRMFSMSVQTKFACRAMHLSQISPSHIYIRSPSSASRKQIPQRRDCLSTHHSTVTQFVLRTLRLSTNVTLTSLAGHHMCTCECKPIRQAPTRSNSANIVELTQMNKKNTNLDPVESLEHRYAAKYVLTKNASFFCCKKQKS